VQGLFGRHEVTDVDGIERAAHDAQACSHRAESRARTPPNP
jgi:hypothetical protein